MTEEDTSILHRRAELVAYYEELVATADLNPDERITLEYALAHFPAFLPCPIKVGLAEDYRLFYRRGQHADVDNLDVPYGETHEYDGTKRSSLFLSQTPRQLYAEVDEVVAQLGLEEELANHLYVLHLVRDSRREIVIEKEYALYRACVPVMIELLLHGHLSVDFG